MVQNTHRHYRSTESKYKGGAHEMYVTYDLKQKTRANKQTLYPKVKRVYIAGEVTDWKRGKVQKRSGRKVSGAQIDYEQTRTGYHRREYTANRNSTAYNVKPATVTGSSQHFTKVVELPEDAENVHFYTNTKKLPKKYQSALQNIQ